MLVFWTEINGRKRRIYPDCHGIFLSSHKTYCEVFGVGAGLLCFFLRFAFLGLFGGVVLGHWLPSEGERRERYTCDASQQWG